MMSLAAAANGAGNVPPGSEVDWNLLATLVLGVLAIVVPLLRESYVLPRRARQELLDRLPWAPSRQDPDDDLDWYELISKEGADIATLLATLAAPRRHIFRQLRHLYRERKIDVCVIRGVVDGAHPKIPAGMTFKMPFIVRGLLPPSRRAAPDEVMKLFEELALRQR